MNETNLDGALSALRRANYIEEAGAIYDLRARNEKLEKVAKVAKALYKAGYWSRSKQGYKDEDDITYWDAMKAALADLDKREHDH